MGLFTFSPSLNRFPLLTLFNDNFSGSFVRLTCLDLVVPFCSFISSQSNFVLALVWTESLKTSRTVLVHETLARSFPNYTVYLPFVAFS